MIRGDEKEQDRPKPASLRKASPISKPAKGIGKKGISVGVEIGYDRLRLVKMGARKQLLDWREVGFTEGIERGSPHFPQFLKAALAEFCGPGRGIEIWSAISAAEVEIRYLRIPKVPKKQAPNAVYWTFKKESPFNEKDSIFDFEILGEITDEGVRKTEVMAYIAPREAVNELRKTFTKAGYNLNGVSAAPFAMQNILRTHWVPIEDKHVCNLYVGRNWSRIDVFSNGNLLFSRGIRAGMNSMTEAIQAGLRLTTVSPADETEPSFELEETNAEAFGTPSPTKTGDEAAARNALLRLLERESEIDVLAQVCSVSNNETFAMIQPALDRLVRQVERTLVHYARNIGGAPVTRLFISGQAAGCGLIRDYIARNLGIQVEVLDPLAPADAFAKHSPESSFYSPGVGLALSSNLYTPNLIYTFKDKEADAKDLRIERGVLAAFVIFMLVLGSVYFGQRLALDTKRTEAKALQQELDQFGLTVDKETILKVQAAKTRRDQIVRQYGRRYLTLAVLQELTGMTPEYVNLLNMSLTMGGPEADKPKVEGAEPEAAKQPDANKLPVRLLEIQGFVTGSPGSLEPALAQYLLNLQVSPLFSRPNVTEKSLRKFQDRDVLSFKAELEVI